MIGRQVSHFYIIRRLGSGGMGVVYEAQDTRLPRSIAVKFLRPSLARDANAINRFRREARLASSLNHPNICTVLDADEADGQYFIAMELLQGASLKTRLTAGPLSLTDIVDVAAQTAHALGAAHDLGIVHRDLTPANIFITDSGVVKLLDFGLAKHFATSDVDMQLSDDLTAPLAVAGTIHYMAPELFSKAEADGRTDLFSLGAVVYEAATGARPFEAASKEDIVTHIEQRTQMPLRDLAPHLPEPLQAIVDRLLAKAPEHRYQTAAALRADLESLTERPAGRVADRDRGRPASVAVLPFDLIGTAAPEIEEFRAGLAQAIRGLLTRPGVRVVPRTSTLATAGESIRTIGRRLQAEMVIEGSVQHANASIRVVANLIDAEHESSIVPPVSAERPFSDMLALQDTLARELVDVLAPALARAPVTQYTRDPEAYRAFKRGQYEWRSCFSGGWQAAVDYFQQAIGRDPQFARAHVALANAYNFLGLYSLMKPGLAFAVARQAAERALAIESTLAEAHAERAVARFGGDWDWDESERGFRRALELNPANAMIHIHYSWLLMLLEREDAAFREAQAGCELAPTSRLATVGRAQTLYLACRYDEAIALCNQCLQVDESYVFAVQLRGLCALAQKRHEAAIADLERAATLAHRSPFYLGLLGLCYGECGMRHEALEVVAELNAHAERAYVAPQCYVFVHCGLGEPQKALGYQEQAYVDGASPLNYLTPSVRKLYALDAHHQRRLEQMRLRV